MFGSQFRRWHQFFAEHASVIAQHQWDNNHYGVYVPVPDDILELHSVLLYAPQLNAAKIFMQHSVKNALVSGAQATKRAGRDHGDIGHIVRALGEYLQVFSEKVEADPQLRSKRLTDADIEREAADNLSRRVPKEISARLDTLRTEQESGDGPQTDYVLFTVKSPYEVHPALL